MNPLRNALAGTQQFLQNAASNAQPMMRSAYAGTQQLLHDAASTTRDKAAGVEWDKAPKHIQDYITEHPYQTAFYVANGVIITAPFVVAAPLLGAVGFTAAGPAAGSIAAGAQGASVAAGSFFATLQSAAMGGYGAAVVGGTVQAGAAVGGGAVGAWNFFRGWGGGDGENNKDKDGDGDQCPADLGAKEDQHGQGEQHGQGDQGDQDVCKAKF